MKIPSASKLSFKKKNWALEEGGKIAKGARETLQGSAETRLPVCQGLLMINKIPYKKEKIIEKKFSSWVTKAKEALKKEKESHLKSMETLKKECNNDADEDIKGVFDDF